MNHTVVQFCIHKNNRRKCKKIFRKSTHFKFHGKGGKHELSLIALILSSKKKNNFVIEMLLNIPHMMNLTLPTMIYNDIHLF